MTDNHSEFFTKDILSKLVADIGVAFWVWDAKEDKLHYNNAFFDLVGYKDQEKELDLASWEAMVHPEDREIANKQLVDYLEGKVDSYVVECRVTKENGEVIWILDNGKATKFGEQGEILTISGITQDITKRKEYEFQFKKEESKLKLAMKFAHFSVWEWDVETNQISCDEDYIATLGYSDATKFTTVEEWIEITHPDDAYKLKDTFIGGLTGEKLSYDHKLRIKKSNGDYVWVRDMGKVSQTDENGLPTQLIGGRLDIDELETATIQLSDYQLNLEQQIEERTAALFKRDTILLELNQISQKLMATPTSTDFNKIAYSYLNNFSILQGKSRIAIYKNKIVDGKTLCYLDNDPEKAYITEYSIEFIREKLKDFTVDYLSEGAFNEEQREQFYAILTDSLNDIDLNNIDYENGFPTIYKYVSERKVLNIKIKNLQPREFIFTHLQGVSTIVMSPIMVNNEFWGFIMLDDYEDKEFSKEDEETLNLVGSVIAQAIHKNELELIAKEAIEHNKLMLNATPLCCNLWKDGKNIGSNDETARLFGLDSSSEIGEKFNLLSPEFQPCGAVSAVLSLEKFQEAKENGYTRFEWLHCNLQGELIPCEITLVRIGPPENNLISGYARDLREFKALLKDIEETQENLKQAHEEALLSSQAKSNFLANMSHEIRTPMNAISGMTDIILRETKDNEVGEYAENIKRACDSLLAIINDVLDISKIESGKLDIVESDYHLTTVLNDVLTIATNRLELKPLMFTANFQSDLPDMLIGDDVRIKQVMVNILNNAIKFTAEGSITFDVKGEWSGGLLQLEFSVTDTGVGISEEDIEKLFIEFERVNTKKNRSIEGTGLGLAISKRLSEMMNGYIEVESELGKGTKFSVTLLQTYNEYVPIAKLDAPKSVLVFESRDLYKNSIENAFADLSLNDVVFCSLQSEFNEALQDKSFNFIFTSSMYLVKVQEMLLKYTQDCKIVLLADTADIKSKYDYTTIMMPATSVSIANVLNGKVSNTNNNKSITNFTAPECNVLVVDDNLVNIKVAQGLMQPYKFKIQTAENGQEAVNKIKNNKYDLVFMDHMMPIMDGIDATIAVRKLEGDYYKNLPIIALTANAIIGTKEMFINEGMNDFLAKPIKLSYLNDILAKWLPKEKQIIDDGSIQDEDEIETKLYIPDVDTDLGIQRVGGDFKTYIEILDMYYKDGLKRIPNIRNLFDLKSTLEYKIEVHALKSASASVGALKISEKASKLEDAANKDDWAYIGENAIEFIDELNILLENIREALKGFVADVGNNSTELGDATFFVETLKTLSDALDSVDIGKCDELMDELFSFNWDEEKHDILTQIKEFINGYEYDEAIELVEKAIN